MASDEQDVQDVLLPEWTKRQSGALSTFPAVDNTDSRLRRIEKSIQFSRRGTVVGSSSPYRAVSSLAVTTSGIISLNTASGFAVKGSMPPCVASGGFAYTSDTSSIHLYWDGTNSSTILVLKRADGSTFTVPGGDINITGLSANTTYYFYPFWSTLSGCAVGFVAGDSGSDPNKFAFSAASADALQQQNLLGREPLSNGAITAKTTAAGSGGGGTGGGGFCVMSGTHIEPLLDEWDYEIRVFPETEWIRVTSRLGEVNVVPGHTFYYPDGQPVKARSLHPGEYIVHKQGDVKVTEAFPFTRVCTKWQVVMTKGHLYFANGYLSHNVKLSIV